MSSLSVHHLCFSYGHEATLHDIDFQIAPGDFVCLLGESGCGKSTFLRLLAGLEKPTSGSIAVNGQTLRKAGLDRGVVFQDYSLFPWLTTGYNIFLSLRQKFTNTPKELLKAKILKSLHDVGLDASIYGKYPFELSGGMRQRCAICRSFALDPPILLMDEPFGALDAVTRVRLQRMILQLWNNETQKKTIVFVTHDVDEALLLATRIIMFGSHPGRVIYDYTFPEGSKPDPEHLLEDHAILELRNQLIHKLNRDISRNL